MRPFFLVAIAALALAAPASAHAQTLCPASAVSCVGGPAPFVTHTAGLPSLSVDTGFLPANSPFQLRFEVFLGGTTEVDLPADVSASWPDPIRIAYVGQAGLGRLRIDYGFEVRVTLRIDIDVAGVHFGWEGVLPIPGIPSDLRMSAETAFDPLLLPGAPNRPVTASDASSRVTVAALDLTGGIVPLDGLGGGLALDAQASLDASYATTRLAVNGATAITADGGTTTLPLPPSGDYGASQNVIGTPEGQIAHTWTLSLFPKLFFKILGYVFDVDLFEVPIPIATSTRKVVFPSRTFHVPLPDVGPMASTLDFGTVPLGSHVDRTIVVPSAGEATLDVLLAELPPGITVVAAQELSIAPGTSQGITLRFAPEAAGSLGASVVLLTNDPDQPEVTLALTGTTPEPLPMAIDAGMPSDDAGIAPDPGTRVGSGGCGCVVAPRHAEPSAPFCVIAVVALAGLVRRARRRA